MQLPQATDAATNEDLTLSQDEVKRLEECFKDQKFRDLLSDYVKEISNPQTKLAYEEYLKQVENEGGAPQNRQLMKPIPQFCIKAKVMPDSADDAADQDRKKHIFINCCSGKLVQDAKLANSNGFDHPLNCSGSKQAGLCWQIPYILGHKRFDPSDAAIIYDIAFSPKTIELCQQQKSFKRIVIQTALEAVDGVEKEYNLYTKLEADGKKYKILKSTKCKAGNVDPPLMSVYIANQNASKRLVDTTKTDHVAKQKHKTMKYKIVESAEQSIDEYWSDRNLLIEPFKRPKYIYIVIELEQISSIKDIDCQIVPHSEKQQQQKGKYQLIVNVKNKLYNECRIDLKHYDIVSSSMNVLWYKTKNELKITFDVAALSKQQVDEIKAKYAKLQKPIISVADECSDDQNAFLFKEVQTKRIAVEEVDEEEDDHKGEQPDTGGVPVCHHKLPMDRVSVSKQGINHGREYWVCSKSQNERCTAFKWADAAKTENQESGRKRVLTDFEVEKREKFDKIVLLIRITNILQTSVKVAFEAGGEIAIEFETHHYRYCKTLKLEGCCIDVAKSRFDVNDRNLLIMVVKKEKPAKEERVHPDIADCVDGMLNDSTLFEIE